MPLDKSIKAVQDYGHIELSLDRLLEEREIKRGELARCIDARFEVIDKWHKGDVSKMDLDVLARICYVLGCSVSDVMEYKEK